MRAPPRFISPMLARAAALPAGEAWAAEPKIDGIRLQVRWDGDALRLRTRPGRDCTQEFIHDLSGLADVLDRRRVVLDGELVCFGADGKPDFEALRRQLGHKSARTVRRPVCFCAFDVLYLDGVVWQRPYVERRGLLTELGLNGPGWRTAPSYQGATEAVLAAAREHELEGIVVKRLDSRYEPGARSSAWVKHKLRRRERLLITAWQRGRDGDLDTFFLARRGADGELFRAGSAQYGLQGPARERLRERLAELDAGAPARRRVRPVREPVEVAVDAHGSRHGVVRDPILRQVLDPT